MIGLLVGSSPAHAAVVVRATRAGGGDAASSSKRHASARCIASKSGGSAGRGGCSPRFAARGGGALVGGRERWMPTTATGGGSGDGGRGGGNRGGDRNDDEGDEGDGKDSHTSAGLALPTLVLFAHLALSPPDAHARASSPSRQSEASAPDPKDVGVCFVYGFSWFYGLKLFLKHLFSPVLLFVSTMWLLTRMRVLPVNLLPDAFNAYLKPYVPREWQTPDLNVVGNEVKSAEKKFWAFVHRVLPASHHPVAEKAFFAGIILAGLV